MIKLEISGKVAVIFSIGARHVPDTCLARGLRGGGKKEEAGEGREGEGEAAVFYGEGGGGGDGLGGGKWGGGRGVGEVLGEGAVGDFGGDEEVEDDRLVGAIEGDENPISLIGANDGVGVLFCLDRSSASVAQGGMSGA